MGYLIFFLLFQLLVDWICQILIPMDNLFGIIAYYLATSLIIAFVWALIQIPKPYRKEFYKQPLFHKNMLTFFLIFMAIDLLFMFVF